jgi:hypothetical protein
MLDADHDDDVPLRFWRVEDVIGPASPPGLAERELEEQQLLASEVEPASFEEALKHENWRHAMLDEFTSIEVNDTWELVEPELASSGSTRPNEMKLGLSPSSKPGSSPRDTCSARGSTSMKCSPRWRA